MRETGRTTQPTAEADSSMPTVTSMWESGSRIRHMVLVHISIPTARAIRENGKRTNSTDKGVKNGQMVQNLRENTKKERKTEPEHLNGVTVVSTKESSWTIIFRELVSTLGPTRESTMVPGN